MPREMAGEHLMAGALAARHTGHMSSSPFAGAPDPSSLDWAVTPDQRARAEDYLQRAYADGRLSGEEFDKRIGMALSANTRRELNQAFDGLARIPSAAPGDLRSPCGLTAPDSHSMNLQRRPEATAGGAVAYFSGAFTWLIGPAIAAAVTPAGSPAHRQAAKAFNATVSFTVIAMVLSVLQSMIHPLNMVTGLVGLFWFVFMIVGGVKAANGEEWTNPFTRVLPIRAIDDGTRRRRK